MRTGSFDAASIRDALRSNVARVSELTLGRHNEALGTARQLRGGRKGSLAAQLSPGKSGLWFDHETGQGGDFLALIRRERGCDFPAPLSAAADLLGGGFDEPAAPRRATSLARDAKKRADHTPLVRQIGCQTVEPAGTLVETYLASRRLSLPPDCRDIRFHTACPRDPEHLPAMITAMRGIATGELCGLHRTFLTADGGKVPERAKLMLGRARGAAIKLSPDEAVTLGLHIVEGIESRLALLWFGLAPTWAVGSAGAIRNFPVLAGIEALTIATDNDLGEAGLNAARACEVRWRDAGKDIRLLRSPAVGEDIADPAARAAR